MSVTTYKSDNVSIWKVLLSSIISVIVSMGLILIFALLIKWFDWSDGVISVVNIAIKISSIIVGVVIISKSSYKNFISGILVGVGYIILSYLCFSLLLGSFTLGLANLLDLALGVIVGGITGMALNVIKK